MYIDKALQFSDAQAVTADAVSENITDLKAAASPHATADQTIGQEKMYLVMIVDVAFLTTVSMDVSLRSSDEVTLNSGHVTHATKNILLAALTAGSKHVIGTFDGPINERYVGAYYDMNTNATAGAVTTFLTKDIDQGWPLA